MTVRPTCGTCAHWDAPDDRVQIDLRNPPPGACKEGPPHVQIFAMPDGKGGIQQTATASAWPQTRRQDGCGRHRRID